MQAKEQDLWQAVAAWWQAHTPALVLLAENGANGGNVDLITARADLLNSFIRTLAPNTNLQSPILALSEVEGSNPH